MRIYLRLQGVRGSYGNRQTICSVSLSVREGQSLAIIGPNGAGKSTLLKMIAGFVKVDSGKILLDDYDISLLQPYERAHLGIGYLMQGGKTFPSLTVGENLAIGASVLPRRERPGAIAETVELFQLTDDLKKPAAILSMGQRQRLAIAIVMVARPATLLLDEPSAGLAPALVQDIFALLREYQKQREAAILLVEQHLAAAINFADRVAVLVDGRITADTKDPQKMLSQEVLDSLFWSDTAALALS